MINIIRTLACLIFFCVSTAFATEQLITEPDMGREPILAMMNNAKSSIKLVIYGLTDKQFINALINAKDQGKNVQVLLEPSPYLAQAENNYAKQTLRANDFDLQLPNPDYKLTHQKTLVIDQNTAVIMTFNFTNATFKKERNFALIITDPDEIQEIQRVFSADWQHIAVTVNNPNLVWSPNNSREKILDFINNAHQSIKIYAEGLSDSQVIGALAKAAHSGVRVEVLMSKESHRSQKKSVYLADAGVQVRISKQYMIHAKVILIDDKRALLGSINLTKPSMDSNRELSIITASENIVQTLNQTFDADWASANKAALDPTQKTTSKNTDTVLAAITSAHKMKMLLMQLRPTSHHRVRRTSQHKLRDLHNKTRFS